MSSIIAKVANASKEYKTGDTTITALQPTSLEIETGQLTLIIGPSGSGKTTLLSLIGCVIYPTSGEVWVDGVKVNDLNENQLAALRLNKIGFVFQGFNLIAQLNGLENVMLPLELMGISHKEARNRAMEALEKVKMTDRMKNLPKALSGGQQQRVAIARALVTNPKIMLCDEPTAALDTKSVSVVMEELKMLAQEGKALAVVTHDLRLRQFADRIIYVNDGFVSDKPFEDENLSH